MRRLRRTLAFTSAKLAEWVAWLRYAADIISVSGVLCSKCLLTFVASAYAVSLDLVSAAESPVSVHHWLDLDLHVRQWSAAVLPHNKNRNWLLGRGPREHCSILPWPGCPPTGFGHMRALVLGRLSRGNQIGCSSLAIYYWGLELLLEWVLLSYPDSVLRAVFHSFPPSPVVRALRLAVRQFVRLRAQHPVGPMGGDNNFNKSGNGGAPRKPG